MKGNQTWTITTTHQNPLAATTHNGYTRHTTTVTPIVTDNQQNKCLFMCQTHKSFASTTVDPQHLNQTRRSSSIAQRNNWGAKNQWVHMGSYTLQLPFASYPRLVPSICLIATANSPTNSSFLSYCYGHLLTGS